ncbi:MAG: polysaccharide deacetylase [Lachnospiraceae bacterium]|uniref:Polysaccharide deacetylase n=1 Tax=Candidatus Weimeria bifida TaxID=2599074 RepID=A0A6N7J061_9FIRM|nr:polysaccharide deacetylase [Candidatus Weimeria bifida]RRF96302.1 MAG: polysaccharide deacetylase [Lachnospiraceae bacterium]
MMNETDNADQIRERRNKVGRVHRMKKFLTSFLIFWVLFSIAAIIFLGIFSIHLYSEVKDLNETVRTLMEKDASSANTRKSSRALTKTKDTAIKTNDVKTDVENLADESDVRKVYLTFDDGPSVNTDKILNILDDYNVKATFFVNGRTDAHSVAMYKRIVKEGHTIGMHSYTHDYGQVYASLSSFKDDFFRIQKLIYKYTGVKSNLYRFPGGSSNTVSRADMSDLIRFLDKEHVRYFDWNVSSEDASSKKKTSDEIIENIMRDVVKYRTSVVLMHDAAAKDSTVEALPKLIQKIQGEGDIILPIDDNTRLIQHVSLSTK